MKILLTLVTTSLILLTACSGANWYQSAKTHGEIECRKEPEGRYEECMKQYDTTYQQYRQQQEEISK